MMFRSKLSILLIACITTYTSLSIAADNNQAKLLDSQTKSIVSNQKDCIYAAKNCLLEVSPFATNRNEREYNVIQLCDSHTAQQLYLYKLSIKDQVAERHFLGNSFCDGIVSISNMKLPFSKGKGIEDANDGLLLVEYLQSTFDQLQKLLDTMKKLACMSASGVYSSTQMSNINAEFQSLLCEINRIAYVTNFNGLSLLDHDGSIFIPIHAGAEQLPVKLLDATVNASGLDIYYLDVSTQEGGQAAVKKIPGAKSKISFASKNLKTLEPVLTSAIEHDATITTFDIRGEEFVVQQKGELLSKQQV